MQSSNDGRTWTMTLRKGAKFSDGSPMTTEDVAFFVEDVAQYEPFSTAIVGDSRRLLDAEFEVIDDYTFSLTFPQPNIALVGYLAEWYFVWFHKGYLSQFHPEYAGQDKVDALAKEAGFASAAEFFKDRVDEGQGFPRANPDLPTMAPWVLKVGAPATTYVFERNPYYLGIDAIGQQLPYFDEVRQDSTTDPTVLKLRALNGEYDWILFLGLDIFPAAKTAEANEQIIRARSWSDVHLVGGAQLIEFNQTTNDPDMRELASNRDFRCGVSHAINREAIATLIYYGAVPYGPLAYSERSPFYNERAATMCGDYDLDAANSLLDSAGLNERDDDGNRLWKGKPFEFTSTIRIQYNSAAVADIVKQNLGDVGINMNIRSTDGWGGLQSVRNSGEMQAYIGPAWATYATDELATASFGAPFNDQGYFAPKWTQWVASDGAGGRGAAGRDQGRRGASPAAGDPGGHERSDRDREADHRSARRQPVGDRHRRRGEHGHHFVQPCQRARGRPRELLALRRPRPPGGLVPRPVGGRRGRIPPDTPDDGVRADSNEPALAPFFCRPRWVDGHPKGSIT